MRANIREIENCATQLLVVKVIYTNKNSDNNKCDEPNIHERCFQQRIQSDYTND